MFPDFNTTSINLKFTNNDLSVLSDDRWMLRVPVAPFHFHALSISAVNVGYLSSEPSNWTEDYFAARAPRISSLLPTVNTILGNLKI